MEIFELDVPSTSQFTTDYLHQQLEEHLFFDYSLNDRDAFHHRKNELTSRHFPREELVRHLLHYNKKFQCGPETIQNIEKLLDPKSVVVIGGQQAGLLTGPLYTIHKIISIIHFAKIQEKNLNIPVIPVFWIAGEDHDFNEINHIYVKKQNKVRKKVYPEYYFEKKMVSQLSFCKTICWNWIEEIFRTYEETNYTKDLLHILRNCVDMSDSYTEFFASIIMKLFSDEGIILIDSAHKELREIESSFFQKLILKNKDVYDNVKTQQQILTQHQYQRTIEMIEGSVNLFYHLNDERILLQKNSQIDTYCGKNGECSITIEDMIETALKKPELLSNNVITRPLMQEYLFPTIAFISGPGEIAYWAELKQAFQVFGYKMPPIVPRLNITILEREISKEILNLELDLEKVLCNGTEVMKQEWLEKNTYFNLDHTILEAKSIVENCHYEIRKKAYEIDHNLKLILEKNAKIILNQFEIMKQYIEKANKQKHEVQIQKFERVALSLRPNQVQQERIWNIFYYLNKYGDDFVNRMIDLNYEFNGVHKVIQI